jgi:hypothetical protein
MHRGNSSALRQIVVARAESLCEYCLIHEEDTLWGCEVDHIISVKHGGLTRLSNLAYACAYCNRQKGSDIGSISRATGVLARFFNPRRDRWSTHFRLHGMIIESLTEIGEVTARILGFNTPDRVLERQILKSVGRYPPSAALTRITDHS